MTHILIIGAGRSATSLIRYLLDQAAKYQWAVTVADADLELARQKVNGHSHGFATTVNILDVEARRKLLRESELVVSMLPAHLHTEVARDCLEMGLHLVTASYISPEMEELSRQARAKGLIFMGEIGLDPGIDHMSAMQKIHEIKDKGGKLRTFRSYTGGLIAPESDNNPWHYKFTWNPRNVVLAGQSTARFLEDGKYKYLPYTQLFQRYRLIEVPDMGTYEAYANRDSLSYREVYGLEDIPTILRGTIRSRGFCEAWDALVQLGLTDHSFQVHKPNSLTYADLVEAYLPGETAGSLRERVAHRLGLSPESEVLDKLEWLGLFSDRSIPLSQATPAEILENLLLQHWKLEAEDKDMIIMQHEFEYQLEGEQRLLQSSLVMKGENIHDTAMARLVGLPLGIFVKLVMTGEITSVETNIPVRPAVYNPVLADLEKFGVIFKEREVAMNV